MAARTTTSCFSFLKEAQLFLARTVTVCAPLLLYAVVAFSVIAVQTVYAGPLTAEMGRHITKMEHADPLSAEYAGLLEEVRQEATELLLISVAIALVLLTLAISKQIVACFTSYSGDRCSLTELLHEVVKYAKGPFIITAVVTILQVTSMAVLGDYFDTLSEALSVFSVAAYMAFLWLGIVAMVIVAASVVDDVEVTIALTDEGSGGVCGLRQAWRRVLQVRRKDEYVLVLVTLLLPTVLGPLYAVALLYTKQSMGLGLCLLSAYEHNVIISDMYYLMAASVYSSQTRKEVLVACDDYAWIPSGEANI